MARDDRLVPQLPLALRHPPAQRLEAYIGAPAAVAQLRALAAGASADALYLQGAAGVGKSHLLLATCAEAEAAGRRPAYLALGGLRGRVREAVEGLDQADLLALDDLDAVAGDRDDEVALFDLHNRLRDAGRVPLYAAVAAPAALGLPDLRSRLAQCIRLPLSPLDDAGRAQWLRRRADAGGLAFVPAALDWMLRRCSRDLPSLEALLERRDRASLAAQRRLTVPFLRQVLESDPG
jgi:DnaA family protein